MELILRVQDSAGRVDDVIAVIDPAHTVVELAEALCDYLGRPNDEATLSSLRLGHLLYSDQPVARSGLMSGDELVIGAAPPGTGPRRLPALATTADVIAGPDSGCWRLLQPGRFSIGRDPGADFVIDDPSVSRHHVVIEVDLNRRVVVHPMAGAANGVTVNDVEIDGLTTVGHDDVVGLGATRLAFRAFERSGHEHHDRLGQIEFHRTPYRPPIVIERPSDAIGPIPTRPEPRRLQIFAVLAPLAAGLAMYAFTHQAQFLALTLISPVVMVATAIEDRRSGRRNFAKQLASFRDGLVAHRSRLDGLRHAERIDRLRAAPDLADLVRRAELRTIDLWARGRNAPDFLSLRLGLGSTQVQFAIELQQGGADDLRDEAIAAVEGLDSLANVPVSVDLRTDAVIGVHGEGGLVAGIVSSLAIQAATLHSPEDLTIVAAVGNDRSLGWLKWLPHLRSVASPLSGGHLVTSRDETDALVDRLIEVAVFRTIESADRAAERCWPRILLLLDAELAPDAAQVSRLVDLAPLAGISVVWMAASAAGVTRYATRSLAVRQTRGSAMVGTLTSTNSEVPEQQLEVEHLRGRLADRVARSLAPIRDASTASLATSIPRTAPLLDVLGIGNPTAAWVAQLWSGATGYDLRFPIGVGATGNVGLDLVHDGPHTLIGGTSGSGKSELLQSMVAALAVHHPPTRLNFLFVDYKGGASSQVFERLPHTVGYVTNLSAELSLRALTSLRAELNRRMAIMEGRAKDLAEMLEVAPDEAPPSLVIIVDEFATLVKEVPEFVEGVIDIAQRGRSLGIHLVLATQRPSGSVNENILANTNLRISLRMLDRAESTSIIASPAAADIPVPLRGRGLARLGPRQLVEFQSAFAGAPLVSADTRQPVLVAAFTQSDDSPRAVVTTPKSGETAPATHLSALIDVVALANRNAGHPVQRRPWREVLPDTVTLDDVLSMPVAGCAAMVPGRHLSVGLIDAPEQQDQRPGVIDLEEGGGWLVFGSGGSGKTTLLRTIAVSLDRYSPGRPVATIVFDFASRGLAGLRALPSVIDVATGDDLEAVTRHLTTLDAELDRRRHLLAAARAEHLTAYHRDQQQLTRIVVLIDGFGGLSTTLLEPAGGLGMASEMWSELINRLIIDGRQVGIHTVITADRRNAVPSRLHAAVANRLILRHADDGSYAEHGVPLARARGLELTPGRGLLQGGTLIQIASVSSDPTGRAQGETIAAMAAGRADTKLAEMSSVALPEQLLLDDVPTPAAVTSASLAVAIGLIDVSGATAVVDLDWSNLAVAGSPRSGRSTALATVATVLLRQHDDVFVVGPRSSPLAAFGFPRSAFGRAAEVAPFLDQVATHLALGGPDHRVVLVVDDVDTFDDPILSPIFERLANADSLRVVGSLESRAMTGYTTSALVGLLRRARRLLVLQPEDPSAFLQATGVKLPTRPGLRMPPGRGVLLVDRTPTIVQLAVVPGTTANSGEG